MPTACPAKLQPLPATLPHPAPTQPPQATAGGLAASARSDAAAAATATALNAKEHEKRSAAMFAQTEELMKFQFMSLSLSYFSSLTMLKQLKDMNADTTTVAVTSSADAAAAAAAASAAANIPR